MDNNFSDGNCPVPEHGSMEQPAPEHNKYEPQIQEDASQEAHIHTHGSQEAHTHGHSEQKVHPHGHSEQKVHTHGHNEQKVHTHGHSEQKVHTHSHSHTQTQAVLNRMARAIGHMEAVKRMVEDGRDCSEVLIQIAAVRSAINNIGKIILEDHISHCIVDAVEHGDQQALEDLKNAIEKFIK